MPNFNPKINDYSPEARQCLARNPFLYQPGYQNPYAEFAYIPPVAEGDPFFDFAAGNFILDVDKFLEAKLPPKLKDSLQQFSIQWESTQSWNSGLMPFYMRLGNNYPSGVSSPTDTQFKMHFPTLVPGAVLAVKHDLEDCGWYGVSHKTLVDRFKLSKAETMRDSIHRSSNIFLKIVPFFAILGPGDYRFHDRLFLGDRRKYAMFQVCHSYVDRDPYDNLNMPASYYALVSHRNNTVYLCIDSTTLLFDKVQQRWLLAVYKKFKALFPDIKFSLLSYHGLRYAEVGSSAPEWLKYKQSVAGLTSYPSIIFDRQYTNNLGQLITENTLDCNPNGSVLGLNGNIGSGIELFLTTNNIMISTIYTSHAQCAGVDRFSLSYVNGDRQEVKQYNVGYCTDGKTEQRERVVSLPKTQRAIQYMSDYGHRDNGGGEKLASFSPYLQIETSIRGNQLVSWVLARATDHLLSSATWGNPPLDLSLLHQPELWSLTVTSRPLLPYVSPDDTGNENKVIKVLQNDEIKSFSELQLYEYLLKTILNHQVILKCAGYEEVNPNAEYIIPPQFHQTIAMLLDIRYNPAFLLYALLKQQLENHGIDILDTKPMLTVRDVNNPGTPIYFGLTVADATKVHLRMAVTVEHLFDHRSGKILGPVRTHSGRLCSPLIIDLTLTVDLCTGEITNVQFVKDKCVLDQRQPTILYSPYAQINRILKQLDRLTFAEQNAAVASLLENYLHESIVSPIVGQPTLRHRNTIMDLLKTNKRIDIPMDKILPYATTNYLQSSVQRYKDDHVYRTKYNKQCNLDIDRCLRWDSRPELVDYEAEFKQDRETVENQFGKNFPIHELLLIKLQRVGADFLTPDEIILLILLISQMPTVSPKYAIQTLNMVHGTLGEPCTSIRPSPRLGAGHGRILVDRQNRTCSIVWKASYIQLVIITPSGDSFNSEKYDEPVAELIVENNLTTDPRKFIQSAYFNVSPKAKKFLREHGAENVFEEMVDHWRRNYTENLQILDIETWSMPDGRQVIFDKLVTNR